MLDPLSLDAYDFVLPKEQIAQHPASPRDHARLLHLAQDGALSHLIFKDIKNCLRPDDILVINQTRVLPSRFKAQRASGGMIRFDLAEILPNENHLKAFARPAKKLNVGDILYCHFLGEEQSSPQTFQLHILDCKDYGEVLLKPQTSPQIFHNFLKATGHLPLPPYIQRPHGATQADMVNYQTVYAQEEGALAAPTAGLHFTPPLMEELKTFGVTFVPVLLHVGAGTFLPVRTHNITQHTMHHEWGELSPETAQFLQKAKETGRRIISVGTTSLRLLESAAQSGTIQPFSGLTNIFIYPGFRFNAIDALITNFHLPKSSLFMLVSAFCGLETMLTTYQTAIEKNYRFFSYGDACFLEPPTSP